MSSAYDTPGPGRNVAILRRQRDMTQAKLAREAGVSVSLLSKIEIGDRALCQGVAAALARAMGITLDEVLGRTPVEQIDEAKLQDLRSAIRRFDLPGDAADDAETLNREVADLIDLRNDANLSGVLQKLPPLVSKTTNRAHADGSPQAWAMVADVYSAVYWLAARHRWMDLAELAVMKEQLAAQRSIPLVGAVAARDEAGAFLNSGDFDGGLAIVERGIIEAESSMQGRERALSLGLLHLRGLTLAGRAGDKSEAERHTTAAWRVAEDFPEHVKVHGIGFGLQETANHVVATSVDLNNPARALDAANRLNEPVADSLPATAVVRFHLNLARAKLALGDRDGALESLVDSWNTAPQVAKVHPAGQELLRVLISLHKRSNPTLTKLARRAQVTV